MSLRVRLTKSSLRDLEDIYSYIAEADGYEQAEEILQRLELKVNSLSSLPNRGNIPPEMTAVGVQDYRELHEAPYRVFYEVHPNEIIVLAVLDGRRNIRELLEKRLLR